MAVFDNQNMIRRTTETGSFPIAQVLTKESQGNQEGLCLVFQFAVGLLCALICAKQRAVGSLSPFGSEQRSPFQKCVNTLFKRWLGYHIMNISPYYTIRCDVYVVCLRTAVKSVCYRVV